MERIIYTVLIGWELGAGRGHLEPLKPIARALADKGCRLVLAVRDRTTARSVFGSMIGEVIAEHDLRQAPIFLHKAARPARHAGSMAESLARVGFADPALLGPVVRAWARLLDEIKPDAVVAEFAPSLRLASHGRAPVTMLGSGWTVPPDTFPMAPLPLVGSSVDSAARAEEAICRAISSVAGCDWRPDRLSLVLRGEATFVMCPPSLDPYRALRREQTWCPPNTPILSAERPSTPPSIVAYLGRDHPAHTELLKAVVSLNLAACFYFGGANAGTIAGVEISDSPLDLHAVLPSAACVIHHGGIGMSTACLLNGIPQIIMPTDLEKQTNAMSVRDVGAGLALPPDAPADAIGEAILRSSMFRHSAYPRPSLPVETIRAVSECLLGAAKNRSWPPRNKLAGP